MLPDYRATGKINDQGEAISYIYVGYKHARSNGRLVERAFRSSYGAWASFLAPLDGRHGWYDSGVSVHSFNDRYAFAQIEVSRYERFDYRAHVAVVWELPNGSSEGYKDLGMMLSDAPHRLGAYVREQTLYLSVDGRPVCSTAAVNFVSPSEAKYFQVRTETSVVGSNGGATTWDLRVKRDDDLVPRAYQTDCILHHHGISWRYVGSGRFVASGAFDPSAPHIFAGLDPTKPCRT